MLRQAQHDPFSYKVSSLQRHQAPIPEPRVTLMNILKYWLPVLLWISVTFLLSTGAFSAENTFGLMGPFIHALFPSATWHQIIVIHAIIRKLAHITEYAVLGLLLFRAFGHGVRQPRRSHVVFYSLVSIVVCAASDEGHQMFEVSRTASIIDVSIDVLGGILALGACLLWIRVRRTDPRVTTS
jgi:VanZ family protein